MSKLINLDSIGTTRSWDYTQPTLMVPGRYTARSPMNSESFQYQFYERYPALKNMDWTNIALSGGAIIDIILGRTPNDLDFFFYGLESGDELLNRAGEFLHFLLKAEREYVHQTNEKNKKIAQEGRHHYGTPAILSINIQAVRRGSIIEVRLSAVKEKIQIVLCRNENLEMLSSNSDFALCGTVYDGKNVLVPQSARWELENMALVVHGSPYFPTEERLKKYFEKGFDIILPDLDIKKCPTTYLKLGLRDAIQLPLFALSYSKIEGNQIHLDQVISIDTHEEPSSDDSKQHYGSVEDLNDRRTVLYRNIQLMTSIDRKQHVSITGASTEKKIDVEIEENKFAVFAEGDFVMDVLKPWPDITSRQVKNTYHAISEQIYSKGNLDFNCYNQYISVEPVNDFMRQLLGHIQSSDISIMQGCSESINNIVNRQIDTLSALCQELSSKYKDAKTPVLNREDLVANRLTPPEKFYGDYFKSSEAN